MIPEGVPRHVHDYVMDTLRRSPPPQRERSPSRSRLPSKNPGSSYASPSRSRSMSCCCNQAHATNLQAKKGELRELWNPEDNPLFDEPARERHATTQCEEECPLVMIKTRTLTRLTTYLEMDRVDESTTLSLSKNCS